jgi:hypothetical protein
MTEPSSPYPSLFVGQTFGSIEDGRAINLLNAIVSRGQSYKVAASNPEKIAYYLSFQRGKRMQISNPHELFVGS